MAVALLSANQSNKIPSLDARLSGLDNSSFRSIDNPSDIPATKAGNLFENGIIFCLTAMVETVDIKTKMAAKTASRATKLALRNTSPKASSLYSATTLSSFDCCFLSANRDGDVGKVADGLDLGDKAIFFPGSSAGKNPSAPRAAIASNTTRATT